MNWKVFFIAVVLIRMVYDLILHAVQVKSAGNPIPENVSDVYSAEEYKRWRSYMAEKSKLAFARVLLGAAATVAVLLLGAHAAAAGLFPENVFVQLIGVLLFEEILSLAVFTGIEYVDTMKIEEKYGFNRTTMKTFVIDRIRNFLISILLDVILASALAGLHMWLGNWMVLPLTAGILLFELLIVFLYPILSRVGNTFVPLEEGELKEKLTALLTRHGYKVRAIEVMDASRRTTKLNAYFTGFGKMKTIVLYDNLVNAMSVDEICAVFAHELGHGVHKDVMKQQALSLGQILIIALMAMVAVFTPAPCQAFGFAGINYGFAILLTMQLVSLVQPFTQMLLSAYSRKCEYRADRQAVQEGYGAPMITALKTLGRDNFSHLAPAKTLVVLEYSHPPLSERIAAIEKAMKE